MSPTPRLPTYFHLEGSEVLRLDDWVPLTRGTGMLGLGEGYLRVTDVWFSVDHHGPMGDGLHIFLEHTEDQPPT